MFGMTDENVREVYEQLKDRYDLVLTTSATLDEGFDIDCPIIVGKAHGQIIELYSDGDMFILDVMDAEQTKGTHWHPSNVESAVENITKFMDGKADYNLSPFPKTAHTMNLHSSPFEKIKSGEKTIELRLFDEKRQKIKTGDKIVFTNNATGETLTKTVAKLHRFDTFEDLYKALPLLRCGYTAEDIDTAHPSDMEQYYSVEQQQKYGVVGIELC